MGEDAIVRIILDDSASGTSRSATQSITSSSNQSAQPFSNPDRLYRELSQQTTLLNQGFKNSLSPVVDLLQDIRDVLDKDYDYSEKDYRETIQQTNLLKIINASLSGEKGAVTRELQKGLGIKSSDAQSISTLKEVAGEVRELKLSLTPEKTYKIPNVYDPILRIFTKTGESLDSLNRSMLLTRVAFGATAGYALTHTEQIAPSLVPPVEAVEKTPLPNIADIIGNIKGLIPDLISLVSQPGVIAPLVGGLVGLIAYALVPKKEEKEKSTNELLQEIANVTNSGNELTIGQTRALADSITNQDNYLEDISNATRVIAETAGRIESLMPGYEAPYYGEADRHNLQEFGPDLETIEGRLDKEAGLSPLSYRDDYPNAIPARGRPVLGTGTGRLLNSAGGAAGLPQAIPMDQTLNAPLVPYPEAIPLSAQEQQDEIFKSLAEEIAGVPITTYPQAEELVPDTSVPTTLQPITELHDPWEGWHTTQWTPNRWLTAQQLAELAPSNVQTQEVPNTGGRRILSAAGLEQFLQYRERNNLGPPEYFASGGMVGSHPGSPRGTDTVPAWLTPGEVVLPARHMAQGGVVYGASYGAGLLATGGAQLLGGMANTSTDPSERISKFGDVIGMVGSKLLGGVPVIGAFVEGLGAGVKGVAMLVSALNESADRYGEYSPEIAQAQAMVEIRSTMGDMRRAQQIGPDLAKFVITQGEIQQKFEEVKIKLLMQIAPAINNILEVLNNVVGSGDGVSVAITSLTAPLTIIAEAAKFMANLQQDAKLPEMEDPTNLILNTGIFDTSVPGGGGSVPIR